MDDLNPKGFAERKFAQICAETNDPIKAYKEAYPENASKIKYLKDAVYNKLKNPKVKSLIEEIQQGIRLQLVLLAPEALENILALARNAENERVKLDANKEILYGAGMRPPEQVELKTVGIFGSASPEEIRDAIRAQLGEAEKPIEAEIIEQPN